MITAKYVRENLDAIEKSMKKRHSEYDIGRILELDEKWRAILGETQKMRERRNKASLEISDLKKNKKEKEAQEIIREIADLKVKLEKGEKEQGEYETQLNKLLWNLPNTLHESVPYGKDDTQNVLVRKSAEPKKRPDAKGHEEVALALGLLDMERAAKVAGARFYYLKGDLVLLEQSLIRFALDKLARKGYTPIEPPFMMREKLYRGVTALGDFDEVLYHVGGGEENDGLRLIATSEHPMAAMHADEVIEKGKLPIRYVGTSPCFRMEVGTHGKDTKGIFRVHHFNKVEQFIFCRQEDSWALFEELVSNQEEIIKELKIPYRLVSMCTGDIGIVAAKKYDIEAYMPAQDKYMELTSASNCTDWQSLRLDIKYDDGNERKYVHTLNATAVATTRALVAIIENYANPDGTITVPDALVPYMNKRKIG
ncbi:MAG: serine--tRNA ligase [Candidatus Micrarchaeota archaeon]|nr:serine--tRNA ligase [Candidatus Micrarchaeota archaeon]